MPGRWPVRESDGLWLQRSVVHREAQANAEERAQRAADLEARIGVAVAGAAAVGDGPTERWTYAASE